MDRSGLEKFLKINLRVILLTGILLVLFDILLQTVLLPRYLNPDLNNTKSHVGMTAPAIPRLPADDIETISLWKNQMVNDTGYKIVFLGDSVVHGGGVPDQKSTIPAYLCKQLRIMMPAKDIKVYNFSLPGCTPADTYNILSYILDAGPDLVIYDVNIGWFGSGKIMEHPRLANLNTAPAQEQEAKADEKDAMELDLDKRLTGWISDHWALYRNRIFLNYVWFGKPLKEQFTIVRNKDNATDILTNDKEIYKPWYEKNFDVLQKTQAKLGYVDLTESNQHWLMYNQLANRLEEQGVASIFFMVPRNQVLYRRYDLLDDRVLKEKQAQLSSVGSKHGITVYDYTFAVNDRYFVDTVHLTAQGNRAIAEHLAWNLVKDGIIR